jgi:DNA-binding NarL/FixJ family response regulator
MAGPFVLSLKTARNHVSAVLAKLGVSTRAGQWSRSARLDSAGLDRPGTSA